MPRPTLTLLPPRKETASSPLAPALLALLRGLSAGIDRSLHARGRPYLWQVRGGLEAPAPGKKPVAEVRCRLRGSGSRPYVVTLAQPDDAPGLEGWCTCPSSAETEPCKHVAAVVGRLIDDVSKGDVPEEIAGLALRAGQATWEHDLSRLDRALAGAAAGPELVGWCIALDAAGLWLEPVARRGGTGDGLAGERTIMLAEVGSGTLPGTGRDRGVARLLATTVSPHGRGAVRVRVDLMDAVLELLADHPHVELAGMGISLGIERATAGLAVIEEAGEGNGGQAYRLVPTLGGRAFGRDIPVGLIEGEAIAGLIPAERRLLFAAVPESAARIVGMLGASDLKVPREAAPLLLARLASLESVIPVAVPPGLAGREVEPDLRIHARLTPLEAGGATVELRFGPVPGGPAAVPGGGPARFAAVVDGECRFVDRDLAGEIARVRSLCDVLIRGLGFALGVAHQGAPPPLSIERDEEVLDLLAMLEAPPFDAAVVVEWPEGAERRRVVSVRGSAMKVSVREGRDWFGLEGGLDVEGDLVPLAALLAAAREGRRYVSAGAGRHVALARLFGGRLRDLALLARDGRQGPELARPAALVAADLLESSDGTDLADRADVRTGVSFRDLLVRAREGLQIEAAPPEGLTATLRPYQVEGYRFLRRLEALGVGGCLADDMGLGKTVQAIALLVHRAREGPALVVAPTSVGFGWMRELARFAPSLAGVAYRTADRGAVLEGAGPGDVIVASYGLLRQDRDALAKVDWATLVLDEAQAFKNRASDTARSVRSLRARFTVALTGTPLENHLGELYSLFEAVAPGLLGSPDEFVERFAAPIERGRDRERRRALARLVRPFLLRRTKGEVLKELPERSEVRLDVVLSKPERALYEATRLDILAHLTEGGGGRGGEDQRFQVLAALLRLRQLACHARLVEPAAPRISAKLEVLLARLEEILEEGHRALIFSQFTRHLALVREALDERSIRSLYLDGGTPPAERERLVDAFQRGEAPVFLISLRAGGTGLNLTAADYVFHLEPWWNPAVEDQAADRAHRIGQTRPVTVVRIVARDTIEEKVLELHAEKRDLVAGVLDGTDRAGKLSTAELVALIREGALRSAPPASADAEDEEDPASSPARSPSSARSPAPALPAPAPPAARSPRPRRGRASRRETAAGTATGSPARLLDVLPAFRRELARDVSPSTAAMYRAEASRMLRVVPGAHDLSAGALVVAYLERVLAKRSERAPGSRALTVCALRKLLRFLQIENLISPDHASCAAVLVSSYR